MVASGGIRRRVALSMRPDAGVTAAAIAAAVGLHPCSTLWIDGRPFGAEHPADELPLRVGAELRSERPSRPAIGTDVPSCWATHRAGVRPFHRSPRQDMPLTTSPIELPELQAAAATASPFSWAAVAVPLVIAVPMMMLIGPRFALFAMFGPVIAVGSWLESRRRTRKEGRRVDRENGEAGLRLQAKVANQADEFVRMRRGRVPAIHELLTTTADATTHLWRRAPGHADYAFVHLGEGTVRWTPTCGGNVSDWPQCAPQLIDAPIEIAFGPGTVVGLVGNGRLGSSLVRWMVAQLVVDHGPSSLRIGVRADAGRRHDWEWARWLPHADHQLGAPENHAESVLTIGIIDGTDQLRGRHAGARDLLHSEAALIVMVDEECHLPANTGLVIDVKDHGGATFRTRSMTYPEDAQPVAVQQVAGLRAEDALDLSRTMASLDDPECCRVDAGLPDMVALASMVDLDDPTGVALASRWSRAQPGTLHVALGADEHGPVIIDLVSDGPHALIGGTTGSGKSELLRSMVCSLAASYDPATVNMVLIDYKGGSAFDVCSALPHVVGVVTDLDEGMAARALRCLRAELLFRETVLRSVGAEAMSSPEATSTGLARLVVIIDEFATMAADLPEFLDALIGIAQRGRSLGVHLVLATQRPGGSIRADIRANTAIRIALRVADAADSTDIIDGPDAVHIDRRFPGRAIVRLGPGECTRFQAATVTAASSPEDHRPVLARPVLRRAVAVDGPLVGRDIDRLVRAAKPAGATYRPRVPWPDPLPEVVGLVDDGSCGLVDEPDQQRQSPLHLRDPLASTGIFGGDGGPVLSVLAGWFHAMPELHVQVIAATAAGLRLSAVPGVGTVAAATEPERVRRLLEVISGLVVAGDQSQPPVVLVVDDLDELLRGSGRDHAGTLERIAAAGARSNVGLLVAGDGVGSGITRLRALLSTVFTLRGGRHGENASGDEVVFANVDVSQLVKRSRPRIDDVYEVPRPLAAPTAMALGGALQEHGTLRLVIGQSLSTLEPAYLDIAAGGRSLIAGPAGPECGTLLALLARQLVEIRPTVLVGQIGALAVGNDCRMERTDDLADALRGDPKGVVLVDDATLRSDSGGLIAAALDRSDTPALIVGARYDRVRTAFGHWVHDVRAQRSGVLLRPDVLDPELLSAVGRLGPDTRLAGRGAVVNDGVIEPVRLLCEGPGRPRRERAA